MNSARRSCEMRAARRGVLPCGRCRSASPSPCHWAQRLPAAQPRASSAATARRPTRRSRRPPLCWGVLRVRKHPARPPRRKPRARPRFLPKRPRLMLPLQGGRCASSCGPRTALPALRCPCAMPASRRTSRGRAWMQARLWRLRPRRPPWRSGPRQPSRAFPIACSSRCCCSCRRRTRRASPAAAVSAPPWARTASCGDTSSAEGTPAASSPPRACVIGSIASSWRSTTLRQTWSASIRSAPSARWCSASRWTSP
mmetsp:Transcript_45654/g.145728  ORF Transcript_45654/g.145728 Transcript_45654/m.145728 type:complete len:255 (-) Transcript_45654:1588-2352(-)